MKIDIECINHNAVRMIKDLLESRYEMIEEDEQSRECGYMLMTIGEIAGIIEMAEAMKEVLKA
jgi:hypothetical protein